MDFYLILDRSSRLRVGSLRPLEVSEFTRSVRVAVNDARLDRFNRAHHLYEFFNGIDGFSDAIRRRLLGLIVQERHHIVPLFITVAHVIAPHRR